MKKLLLAIGLCLITSVSYAQSERKPLSYYTRSIQSGLFTSSSATVQPSAEKPKPQIAPAKKEYPMEEYSYVGTIIEGEHVVAVVENIKTKEGYFLVVGDQFAEGIVRKINLDSIEVLIQKETYKLEKNTQYSFVPLSKSASFLTAQPNQLMPGFNPQSGFNPQNMQQMMMNRLNQRFPNMTPEQIQQMMLNNQFNRGDGRQRGGNSGGGNRLSGFGF